MSRGQFTDPAQVLDVVEDVLLEHMDSPDALPCYRVQDAYLIDANGIPIDDENVISGTVPTGLVLSMRDGSRLRLTLTDENRKEATT